MVPTGSPKTPALIGTALADGDGMLVNRRGDDPLAHRGASSDDGADEIVVCQGCTHAPKGGAGAQVDDDAGVLWEAIDG